MALGVRYRNTARIIAIRAGLKFVPSAKAPRIGVAWERRGDHSIRKNSACECCAALTSQNADDSYFRKYFSNPPELTQHF